MLPRFYVRGHRLARASRHRAEAVTQQVYAGSEGWKFFAPAIEVSFRFQVSGLSSVRSDIFIDQPLQVDPKLR